MKTILNTVCSLAAFVTLGLGAASARADHDVAELIAHIHDHAHHVVDHSRDLAHEARHELYYDPNYRHLVADINAVARSAARLDSLSRSSAYVGDLCREAHKLDDLVHHLDETVSRMGHTSLHTHHHDHLHLHRPNLREVRRLVRLIEKDTHDLVKDVERLERRVSPAPIYSTRPGISLTPGGVYLGGNNFGIRIGR